jgi:hypothetical protein
VPVLRELVNRPDTPLDRRARQRVLEQLDRAEERFAAILPPAANGTESSPGNIG